MALEFSWWNVVPTLVGGAISLATTYLMFNKTQSTEREKREKENKKRLALSAFNGFRKLLEVSNGLENIKLHIDEGFEAAEKNGGLDLDPYIKILPFVGARGIYKDLVSEELFFLTKLKNSELISELDVIIRRARNNEVVIEKYSELRQDINSFLETRIGTDTSADGTLVSGTIATSDKVVLDLRGGLLNNVLGTLMEHLEADCVKARKICSEYLEAAQAEYQDDFPKIKLEWTR